MNTKGVYADLPAALKRLGLPYMADRLAALGKGTGLLVPAVLEMLVDLVQAEVDGRTERIRHKMHTEAQLTEPSASLEDVWYRANRNLEPALIRSLTDCEWIKRGQHVLVTGATGRGKTWLACALANTALRAGSSVLFRDVPDMLADWGTADADGRLLKLRRRLARLDVLVLDDWGVEPLTGKDVQALRRILHDRSTSRSIILVSPNGPEEWRTWLGDYVGDALVDRIESGGVSISLQGPSLRRASART